MATVLVIMGLCSSLKINHGLRPLGLQLTCEQENQVDFSGAPQAAFFPIY